MKMTKKNQKALAIIINALQCASIMRDSAHKKEDHEMIRHWLKDEELNTCVLGVHFGIKLPCFDRMLSDMILDKGETEAYEAIAWEYDLIMSIK